MIELKNKLSIFVNSCDSFEDCWNPYFTLLNKYWPEFDGPIFLNTESKKFIFNDLNIKSTQVDPEVNRIPWGECLLKGLEQVSTPYVLYMQEDYFIDKPVMSQSIEGVIEALDRDENINSILLYPRKNKAARFESNKVGHYMELAVDSTYVITTQASIWRREALANTVKSDYSVWMFELLGSIRYNKDLGKYLSMDYSETDQFVIDYVHTGIIRGKWNRKMIAVFEENDIEVDFEKRGYYNPPNAFSRRLETIKKLPLKYQLLYIKKFYKTILS